MQGGAVMGSRVLVNIGAQRFDRNTGLHSGGKECLVGA